MGKRNRPSRHPDSKLCRNPLEECAHVAANKTLGLAGICRKKLSRYRGPDQFFDPRHQRRNRGLDRRRKKFSVIETFTGERNRKGAWGGTEKLSRKREHRSRRKLVRKSRSLVGSGDSCGTHLSRLAVRSIGRGGIHKNHGLEATHGFRKLGRELVRAEDLDIAATESLFELIRSPPREPVVAAQRISESDDEDPAHAGKCSPGRIRPGWCRAKE